MKLLRSLIFILAVAFTPGLIAQNIQFTASTDAEEVLLGSYIQVEFNLTKC